MLVAFNIHESEVLIERPCSIVYWIDTDKLGRCLSTSISCPNYGFNQKITFDPLSLVCSCYRQAAK